MIVGMLASLVVGMIIGYLGQRSRMCFVAAVRDYLLIQDTEKLKGLLAFLLVGWIIFPLLRAVNWVCMVLPFCLTVKRTSLLTRPSIPSANRASIVLWAIDRVVRSSIVHWYIVQPRSRCYNGAP